MDKQELELKIESELDLFGYNEHLSELTKSMADMFWPLVETAEGSCYCKGSSEPLCLPCRALSNLVGEPK